MTDEDCFELLNREDMAKWAKERKPGPAKSIDFSYENQEALLVPRQDGIIVNAYVESCDIPVNVEGVGHVAYCKIFIEGDDSPDYMLWPIFSTMPERVLFQLYHDPVEGKHFELRISRFYEELGESITAAMMIRGER